jgi:hypothetical protein
VDLPSIIRRRPRRVGAVAALVFGGLWAWLLADDTVVVPSLITVEAGSPDHYEVALPTPLLIDDERDRYQVTRFLHDAEADLIDDVDLGDDFVVLARSNVCAPYLRLPRIVIDSDEWWLGERPVPGDITDLYNLCEETLIDLHVFVIDRAHFGVFADVPLARDRPR